LSSEVTIRTFEEVDSPEVIALWRVVFSYGAPHNQPERAISDKVRFQGDLFFVALSGERIVGTVMAGYDGHRGWIYSLAVSPGERRKGVGSGLMAHAEEAMRGLGCGKVNLQILAENEAVAEFYRSLGFVIEPRISMGKVL
jgi:ribosomal protein S18 acetylase RimI-like enzyme